LRLVRLEASYFLDVAFHGLVISVLAIGPKVRGLNPAKDDGCLMAIKIHSMTSFKGEVNP
jgi:hypothetical protein